MKIKKIKIKNLRALDDLELDLTSPDGKPLDLVVLAGPNGCGKTTVLEAALYALCKDKLVSRKLPEQDYDIEVTVCDGDQDFGVRKKPKLHSMGEGNLKKVMDELSCFYFSSWRSPKLVGGISLSTGEGKRPPRNEHNTLWRFKSRMVSLRASESFESSSSSSSSEEPDVDVLLESLNKAWKYFYPERNGRFFTRKIPPTKKQIEKGEDVETLFDIFLTDEKRLEGIAVDDLSSGEIENLSMLGMFLSEYWSFDIVFIDEPELHLHPAWHRAILPALRMVAPSTQFICATHSQDILESVYSYERFTILDEDDPRVRLFNPPIHDGGPQ